MKKKLSILTFTVLVQMSAFAQIEILQADAPQAGHVYTSEIFDGDFTGLLPGNKGGNLSWDFSTFVKNPSTTVNSSFSLPTAQDLITFPNSNLVEYDGNDYQYYNINKDNTLLIGQKDTITNKLSPPLLYSTFPVAFGNTVQGNSKVVIAVANKGQFSKDLPSTLADSIRLTLTFDKHDTVDAWGKIKTFAEYNVVRIVTHLKISFQIDARVSIIGPPTWTNIGIIAPEAIPAPEYTTEYNWWAKGIGSPVFTITYDGENAGTIVSANAYSTSGVLSINNNLPSSTISLSPNPSSGNLNFTINAEKMRAFHLQVTDLSGRPCFSGMLNNRMETVDFGNLSNGIYLVKMTDLEGKSLVKKLEICK